MLVVFKDSHAGPIYKNPQVQTGTPKQFLSVVLNVCPGSLISRSLFEHFPPFNFMLMKKTSTKKNAQRPDKTELKWQTGDYSRNAAFKFILPYPFLLRCRLVDKTLAELVGDFTDNLACGSWKRESKDQYLNNLNQGIVLRQPIFAKLHHALLSCILCR